MRLIILLIALLYPLQVKAKDLVIFSADWCFHCQKLKEYLASAPSEANAYSIELLDFDKDKDIAIKLKVKDLPTSIIFNDDGSILTTKVGFHKTQYKEWLKQNAK